jgi:hypothetical protein
MLKNVCNDLKTSGLAGQSFEIVRLYRKYGFIEGDAFDSYEKSPFNQFLHLAPV